MGVYTELRNFLIQAPSMSGVNVGIGEESQETLDQNKPRVILFPHAGEIKTPGSPIEGTDPYVNETYDLDETILFACWARSFKTNPTIGDHYDAAELLRWRLTKALRYQQYHFQPEAEAGPGIYLMIKNRKTEWILDSNTKTRNGRAFIYSVDIKILMLDELPEYAEVDSIDVTATIQP